MSDSVFSTKQQLVNLAWKPLRNRINAVYEGQFKKTNSHYWSCGNHSFIGDRWMGEFPFSYRYPLPEEFQKEAREILFDCIALSVQVQKVMQQVTPLLMLLTDNRGLRLPINSLANLDLESVRAMLSPQQSEDRVIYAMKQYELAKPELQKYIAYQLLG